MIIDLEKLKHDFKGENRKPKLILEEILKRIEKDKELEHFLSLDMTNSLKESLQIWERLKSQI